MSQSTESKLGELLKQFERDIHSELRQYGSGIFGDWGPMAALSVEGYRIAILSRVRASYKMLRHLCGFEMSYYVFRDFLQSNQTLKQIDQLLKEHYSGRT